MQLDLQSKLENSNREKKKTLARKGVEEREKIRFHVREAPPQTDTPEAIPREVLKKCGMTKLFAAFEKLNLSCEFSLNKSKIFQLITTSQGVLCRFSKEVEIEVLDLVMEKKEILTRLIVNNLSDPEQPHHNQLLLIQAASLSSFTFIQSDKVAESISSIQTFDFHTLPRKVYENPAEFVRVPRLGSYYFKRPVKRGVNHVSEHTQIINGQTVLFRKHKDIWFEYYEDKRSVTYSSFVATLKHNV